MAENSGNEIIENVVSEVKSDLVSIIDTKDAIESEVKENLVILTEKVESEVKEALSDVNELKDILLSDVKENADNNVDSIENLMAELNDTTKVVKINCSYKCIIS